MAELERLQHDRSGYGAVPTDNHNPHLSALTASMLAIGGTIGTGLFFSVAAIIQFGPATALALMAYIAFLVVIVLHLTTEMAVFLPGNGLVCKFQEVFLGPLVALANNCIYWLSWGLTFALEILIIVSVCSYWSSGWVQNNLAVVILAVWLALTACNLLPVDTYGQIEFWIALVKVVAIVAWLVMVVLALVASGRPLAIWTDRWPVSFCGPAVSGANRAVNAVACLILSSFIFQSAESVAITSGDVAEPHKTIPRITKLVFVRIVVFYLTAVALLTLAVAFDDPKLGGASSLDLLSSPFLVALLNCGLQGNRAVLLGFNFVILSAIVSAANSNVYFGSRCLEAIGESRGRHSWLRCFTVTNTANVPVNAVLMTSAFGLVALLLRFQSIGVVFNLLLTCCALAGMLMWCLLAASYIRFSRAMKVQKVARSRLRYTCGWNLDLWAWFAVANLAVILACNGLTNYWHFSWLKVVGSYMTPVVFLATWGVLHCFGEGGLIPLEEVELWRGNMAPE